MYTEYFFVSLFLLISNGDSLFSGLLPDNIVLTSENTYCSVKDLEIGEQLISLGSTKYNLRNRYGHISGIRVDTTKYASLITLESSKKNISSLMVGLGQKFCVLTNGCCDDPLYMWMEAQSLKPDMIILGYHNKKFRIRDIQTIELEAKTDLYEISLSQHDTFYIIDSNGNPILTHNLFGLLGWMVIGGALAGGMLGAGIMIYKSYAQNVKISKSSIAKGFLAMFDKHWCRYNITIIIERERE
jgi:hypothetical protein